MNGRGRDAADVQRRYARERSAAEAERGGSHGGAISPRPPDLAALPELLYTDDFAALLRITPKALRHRAARGQVPAPFRLGRALAWTRETVLGWLRDCGRSAGPVEMKIKLRPYSRDKRRWHVDIRLMNPCDTEREIRKRMVAPPGLSEAQARAWGERQVPTILREVLGSSTPAVSEPRGDIDKEVRRRSTTRPSRTRTGARIAASATAKNERPRSETTVAELFTQRFEPEYVRLQKPATQVGYESAYRNHIGPHLGSLPLAALDEDRLSMFRAKLAHGLSPSTVNFVLSKLAKLLGFAKRMRYIDAAPAVEKLREPRKRPKEVYSDAELAQLFRAAAELSPDHALICRLALDAGLRNSEIAALEWRDIDLREGTILVQHNHFRGVRQTPKGTIGKVAMTTALRQALLAQREERQRGPLVLYRSSHITHNDWRPHSSGSIRWALNKAQRHAGLPDTGPHLLRHTMLTRLATLGASVYVVQAVARHTRLQTTQTYIHTQQAGLSREAAALLDQAADAGGFGNSLATQATGP